MGGPKAPELRYPRINLLEWFMFQPIKTTLCVHRHFDETSLAQHAQMLGHHGLRHVKLAFNLSHRLFGRDQQAQDRAAVGLGNDFEY